jgi:2-keto-4-pentenoate hydratase
MLDSEIDRVARALSAAEADRSPISPPSAGWPALTVRDAYRIQLANVSRRVAAGARIVGRKVGLTSRAMQEQLGVDEPDYGHLLDDMVVLDGASIDAARFCSPRIEPEIAFRLYRPLTGPECTIEDVLDSTEAVLPAMEVIDSRVSDWQIGLTDTIADNASSAAVVLGTARVSPREIDLPAVTVSFLRNRQVVESGTGSAVLGHPAMAVAWLANTLGAHGDRIGAGEVVIPGSCTRSVEVRAGDAFAAEFDGLGSVSVRFE